MIPVINIAPLRSPAIDAATRSTVDAAIGAACRGTGFFIVTGHAADTLALAALQRQMLRFFDLAPAEKRRLARRQYAPENRNVYRGYFHAVNGAPSYKEGIDLGIERAETGVRDDSGDPLREANVWPPEAALPGWRAAMTTYARAMEDVGFRLLRSFARHLGLAEDWFDPFFVDGASTLRLLRYPPRPPESIAGIEVQAFCEHHGKRRPIATAEHTDSGCITLLWQDAIGGLQARLADGRWIDVPATDHSLVVNLGDLMQAWTGGAFRATAHRVLGGGIGIGPDRYSIPFFFEPALDVRIGPIPGLAADAALAAAPVRYGDHLRAKISRFTEFRDYFR